jgi:hypothetical protein
MASALELLSYDFLRNAVLAGLLAAVLCGVVGTFVVVKRLVFLAGGVAHAAFGGLGICYFLGVDPRLGAAGAAIVSALALANPGAAGGAPPTPGSASSGRWEWPSGWSSSTRSPATPRT